MFVFEINAFMLLDIDFRRLETMRMPPKVDETMQKKLDVGAACPRHPIARVVPAKRVLLYPTRAPKELR